MAVLKREQFEQEFGKTALRVRAGALIDELVELQRRLSEKAIHDTRVQSRRMRSALEAFQDALPPDPFTSAYDAVRDVTRALAKPRETGVNLRLLQDLAAAGLMDTAENLAHEYLVERLERRREKRKRKLQARIGGIDPSDLSSGFESLISQAKTEGGSAVTSRAERILTSLSQPIRDHRIRDRFAGTTQIHSLRIAAKKLRYAMEMFDPVWPGGLGNCILKARAFQDAAGHYHDWCVLCRYLKNQARRLERHNSAHLALQVGRLSSYTDERKKALKPQILPALHSLQECLRHLAAAVEKTAKGGGDAELKG